MSAPHPNLRFLASAFALLLFVLPQGLFAQEEPVPPTDGQRWSQAINDKINSVMEKPTKFITSVVFAAVPIAKEDNGDVIKLPLVLVWLFVAALILTIYFKFVNLRSFGLAARTIRGRYSGADDPGEITHFQALTAALSATVGLGNIAGVAVAVSIGGPGATFWMIVVGFLGMTSKFAECTLGVKYREIDETGRVFGGPMYYLRKGFAEKGLGGLGTVLAFFFAIMCIGGSFGGGNMFQINQAAQQLVGIANQTGTSAEDGIRLGFGVVVAILVALVIIGGIKSIARVTSKLVPLMCGMYVIAASIVIVVNIAHLPEALTKIFTEAFAPAAVGGGMIGVMIQGVKRAAFSNEAGVGSAPIAHAAVKTRNPASEGIVALLEPFIDTVVVCTMTALVIVITGTYQEAGDGITITSRAFQTVLPWFRYLLFLAVLLFAFSTMISWSYYGQQAWAFVFGRSKGMEITYKVIFCLFVVVGAVLPLSNVIDFSDSMIFAMAAPNILGLYVLMPIVKRELESYQAITAQIDRQ
jgi:alanine or glycine:cation symporter, AGCS family